MLQPNCIIIVACNYDNNDNKIIIKRVVQYLDSVRSIYYINDITVKFIIIKINTNI